MQQFGYVLLREREKRKGGGGGIPDDPARVPQRSPSGIGKVRTAWGPRRFPGGKISPRPRLRPRICWKQVQHLIDGARDSGGRMGRIFQLYVSTDSRVCVCIASQIKLCVLVSVLDAVCDVEEFEEGDYVRQIGFSTQDTGEAQRSLGFVCEGYLSLWFQD